jgi:hypothetical protein
MAQLLQDNIIVSIDTILTKPDADIVEPLDIADIEIVPSKKIAATQQQRNIRAIYGRDVIVNPINKPTTSADFKKNQPRLLDNKELHFILEALPVPYNLTNEYIQKIPNYAKLPKSIYSSDPTVSYSVYIQLYASFFQMLSEMIITPLAINDFKLNFTQYFSISRVIPGTSVGMAASDAISAPLTQMTLNSFANITGSTVSYGLDYIKEILDALSNRKQLSMTIYFQNKYLSFEEVLAYKNSLVEVKIIELVNNYDILEYKELSSDYWYDIYNQIQPIKMASHGLRLYLDVDKLYLYKLDMQTIINTIINESPSLVHIVPSPLFVGIIDIYPEESRIHEGFKSMEKDINITNSNSNIIFLNNVIFINLDKMKIRGITGIKNYHVVESNVLSIVKTENKINDANSERYNIVLNKNLMITTGLRMERLIELLQYLKFKNITPIENENRLIVVMPDDYIFTDENNKQTKLSPTKYILKKIEEDENITKAQYTNLKQLFIEGKSKLIKYPISQLNKLYTYVYAQTNGSNLMDILDLDYVDPDITITNNIFELKQVFGIEAARNFIIKDLTDALGSQGSYIDPKHVVFAADYLTHTGDYLGFTYSGLAQRDIPNLDKASFQRSFDVFFEGGVTGSKTNITSATSSMFVGAKATFGTGSVILGVNNKERDKYLEEIKKIDKVSIGDLNTALNHLDVNADISERLDFDLDEELGGLSGTNGASGMNDVKTNLNIPSILNPISGIPNNSTNIGSVLFNKNVVINNNIERKISFNEKVIIPDIKPKSNSIISDLVVQAVNKIPGIPTLNIPTPISIPIPNSEMYVPPGNLNIKQGKNVVDVDYETGNLVGVKIAGKTESKNAFVPLTLPVVKPKITLKPNAHIKPEPLPIITLPTFKVPKIVGGGVNISSSEIIIPPKFNENIETLKGTANTVNLNDFLND